MVIVRDSQGRSVRNLKQSEFEIRDNGKVQAIRSFALQGATQQSAIPQPAPTPTTAATAASLQTVQRRFVALFFDDLHTEPGDFARVQKAAEQFVQEGLQSEDRVAIFKASESGEVTFTNDKQKLLATIDALRVHPAKNTSQVMQCPRITNYEAYLIVNDLDPEALNFVAMRLQNCMCPPPNSGGCPPLANLKSMVQGHAEEVWQFQRDASQDLLAALDLTVRVLGTMPGRRMLVLTSSGFLSSDIERDVDRVIDNALRGGVVINSLSAKGLDAEPPGGNLGEHQLEGTFSVNPELSRYETQQSAARREAENESMTDFAESTGGKFFKNNNDFLRAFNELAAPEVAYLLAFSPDPLKHDGAFHKLKVELKTPGRFAVYARKGYFAPTPNRADAAHAKAAPAPPVTAPGARIPSLAGAKPLPTAPVDTKAALPAEARPGETPAQPSRETEPAAKNAAPAELPPGRTAPVSAASPSTSTVAKPASADATAEVASERAFLNLASHEVEHYIEAFADLTADETRVMQSFDEHGFADKRRSIQSALVIYRLRNDPRSVIEYRDVISMDGHEIKGHAARATKLWHNVAEAHSTQEEIRRLNADSERYDIGIAESGFTLFEGLPLRLVCAGDFIFRDLHREVAKGRPTRVFAYQQVHPCDLIVYHFALPAQLADIPLLHAGELTLDAQTGQVVREERNVYLGNPAKKSPCVAHIVLGYDESPFGILVPKRIVIETFLPGENVNMTAVGFRRYARMVQTYGPFSRFEVSVGEKVSAPTR